MISNSSPEMVAESSQNAEFRKGSRIECGGQYGTVRYIGPVEGHPGTWLGIDWDDVTRGKHDGTVNGVQYFKASCSKSGSFVRKEKVNFGQTAVNSIITRYKQGIDEATAKIFEEDILSFQKSVNAPFLQLVGFDKVADKQSDFDSLQIVNLRLQCVSSIGPPFELRSLCPNIREIDISKNLLNSWEDVFDVCTQLEHLVWINVSENFLQLPPNYKNYFFPNIRTLICGSMNLTWSDIIKLSSVFPNIIEIRAPFNNITDLTTPEGHNLREIKLLDLEGNKITDWCEIVKLSALTNLQQINLENIGLKSIKFEENIETNSIFMNLRRINLNNNLLNEWESIGELNKLNYLNDLRLTKNPILETENLATREQLIIAKIKSLMKLNGRPITAEERRGAEYDYIKKYGLEWIQVKDTKNREYFLVSHNRYMELIERYGAPEKSELIIVPNILKSSLLSLNIIYEDQLVTKKLPPTILVQKLVMLVEKMFKLQSRPKLRYISTTQPHIEITLDDEMKELGFYSVQDGDKIVVELS